MADVAIGKGNAETEDGAIIPNADLSYFFFGVIGFTSANSVKDDFTIGQVWWKDIVGQMIERCVGFNHEVVDYGHVIILR